MKSAMRLTFLAAMLCLPWPLAAQTAEDCLLCHSDKTLSMVKAGRKVSLFVDAAKLRRSTHAGNDCVSCHTGLDPMEQPHAKVIRPVDCQSCHDVGPFEKSVHGRNLACKDCHGNHQILDHNDPASPVNRIHISETCGHCHTSLAEHYDRSAHGRALAAGIKGAPACIDCHGAHNVEKVTSKESRIYKTEEAKVCLSCHLDDPEVRKRVAFSAGFISAYGSSVHGVALTAGNEKAATCSDCHGAHDMQRGTHPDSLVSKLNTPATCAKCHAEATRIFEESIHGTALRAGIKDAPNCVDCHGEHQIFGPRDPRSRVAAKNVSAEVCAACHASVRLNERYGLPSQRFETFSDSYHGLAGRGGETEVANCASCHGYHDIKPSSDPSSRVHKANLAETCGSCHPGAGENFAEGSVHAIITPEGEAVLYWIQAIYIGIIIVTIGGMFLHNLLDFLKKTRLRLAVRHGLASTNHFGSRQYLRMTLSERIQHAIMFTSFILLVVTGFMLRYPEAWWVVAFRNLSEQAFAWRSLIHRIAGVVMIAVSLYHLYYLAFVPRGRRLLQDLLPRIQDLRDAPQYILYNLGLTRKKPKFDRFGYIEKAEYWALVWGVIIMGATGIILWFDNYFMNLLTKLGWDVARTIHYYEAWLATLAIVVWHFYFVMFNPNVYPMNTAWWTGKLSEEEMADEHALELERIHSLEMQQDLAATEEFRNLDKPGERTA